MQSLKERVESFRESRVSNVVRNGQSYAQCEQFTTRVLKVCKTMYHRLPDNGLMARLIKDLALWSLRRYHEYTIEQSFGAHYRQVGLKPSDKKEFEHVLPVALARDLYFFDKLTVNEVMHIPTCLLSKQEHKKLSKLKLGDSTPDKYNFWKRYEQLGVVIETYDRTQVDLNSWNLDKHYEYFGVKND